MPAKRLTESDIDLIVDMKERGLTDASIANHLSTSRAAIAYHRMRLGILSARLPEVPVEAVIRNGSSRCIRLFTKGEDDRLLDMRLRGVRQADIARELKRSPSVVSTRLNILARREGVADK